jgi:hypothetical protein
MAGAVERVADGERRAGGQDEGQRAGQVGIVQGGRAGAHAADHEHPEHAVGLGLRQQQHRPAAPDGAGGQRAEHADARPAAQMRGGGPFGARGPPQREAGAGDGERQAEPGQKAVAMPGGGEHRDHDDGVGHRHARGHGDLAERGGHALDRDAGVGRQDQLIAWHGRCLGWEGRTRR